MHTKKSIFLHYSFFLLFLGTLVFLFQCTSEDRNNIFDPNSGDSFVGLDTINLIKKYATECVLGKECIAIAILEKRRIDSLNTVNGLFQVSLNRSNNSVTSSPTLVLSGTITSINPLDLVVIRILSPEGATYPVNFDSVGAFSQTIFLPIEGINPVEIKIFDDANNSIVINLKLIYDKNATDVTGPLLTITTPNNQKFYKSPVAITGVATDVSGVKSVTIGSNLGAFQDTNWTVIVPLTQFGDNTLIVRAEDNRGNTSQKSIVVDYVDSDTLPIQVNIRSPASGSKVPSLTGVRVSGTLGGRTAGATVTVNGTRGFVTDTNWTATINLVTPRGSNRVIATVTNDKGATAEDTITLIHDPSLSDSKAPDILITSHTNDDKVSSAVQKIVAVITDASGIGGAQLRNGAQPFITMQQMDDSTYEGSATLRANEPNNLVIRAEDSSPAKNKDSVTLRLFYITDTIGPNINIISPAKNPDTIGENNITIEFSVSDPAGIDPTSVKVNDQAATFNTSSSTYKYQATLQIGKNQFNLTAADQFGNTTPKTLVVFYDPTKIDLTPPSIQLISHNNGDTVFTNKVVFRAKVTDANKISSVKFNGFEAERDAGNEFYLSFDFTNGENKPMKIVATDSSANRNKDSLEFQIYKHIPVDSMLTGGVIATVGGPDVTIPITWWPSNATFQTLDSVIITLGGLYFSIVDFKVRPKLAGNGAIRVIPTDPDAKNFDEYSRSNIVQIKAAKD